MLEIHKTTLKTLKKLLSSNSNYLLLSKFMTLYKKLTLFMEQSSDSEVNFFF